MRARLPTPNWRSSMATAARYRANRQRYWAPKRRFDNDWISPVEQRIRTWKRAASDLAPRLQTKICRRTAAKMPGPPNRSIAGHSALHWNEMINKILDTHEAALSQIPEGASIMVGGFGDAGIPFEMLASLAKLGTRNLTIISNNAGTREVGIARLIKNGQVRKIICSHPRPPQSDVFAQAYRAGRIELECTPQGTLAERMR